MFLACFSITHAASVWAAGNAENALTIATVNNPEMVVMQKNSIAFEEKTGIKLNWLLLDENALRSRLNTDMATKGGQFDVVTINALEAQEWGKRGLLTPLKDFSPEYDIKDVIPSILGDLSADGVLYALPFYAESTITFYRKDLFKKAGIEMPEHPTWSQIREFAAKVDDRANGIYGISLRGVAGQVHTPAGIIANTFGGRLFDMDWKSQYNSDAWKNAVTFFVDMMQKYGPPGVTSNGYNECLALFASGHAAIWVDATVSGGTLYDPKRSKVADSVGFVAAPIETWNKGGEWIGEWAFSIPAASQHSAEALKFVEWATSKEYIKMIGETQGWVSIPAGTRFSTYDNPKYLEVAPFAKATLAAIKNADSINCSKEPKPYVGITLAYIPETQQILTYAGQQIAAALAGKKTVEEALNDATLETDRIMKQGGYQK